MKFKTKVQKLVDAEKYTDEKRAELSTEMLDIIKTRNINIVALLDALGLSRNSYYYFAKNNAFPTDWIKKISQSEPFKQIDF